MCGLYSIKISPVHCSYDSCEKNKSSSPLHIILSLGKLAQNNQVRNERKSFIHSRRHIMGKSILRTALWRGGVFGTIASESLRVRRKPLIWRHPKFRVKRATAFKFCLCTPETKGTTPSCTRNPPQPTAWILALVKWNSSSVWVKGAVLRACSSQASKSFS